MRGALAFLWKNQDTRDGGKGGRLRAPLSASLGERGFVGTCGRHARGDGPGDNPTTGLAADPRLNRLLTFATGACREEDRVIDLLIRDSTASMLSCARCGFGWLRPAAHSRDALEAHAPEIGA